jgi:transcriptional regulator with XRE-family HTH domain
VELRRLREANGRSQTEIGFAIGVSQASLVNWEKGRTRASDDDLQRLLVVLEAKPGTAAAIKALHAEATRGGSRWRAYRLPEGLKPFVSYEEEAVSMYGFELALIPGLLQTENYARAVHVASPYITKPDEIEPWVNARLKRQQRLTGTNPLGLHVVISEACLVNEFGGKQVLAEQLDKLVSVTDQENVTLQLVPHTRVHAAMTYTFGLFYFADKQTLPVGYYDTPYGAEMIQELEALTY